MHQYWAVRVKGPTASWSFLRRKCPVTCSVMSVSVHCSWGSRVTWLPGPSEGIWALQRSGSGAWALLEEVLEDEEEDEEGGDEERRWMKEALISCSEGRVSRWYWTVKV